MAEINFEPNSHKYREQQLAKTAQKDKRPVARAKGRTTPKKQSLSKRFISTFLCADKEEVKSYLIEEVIIPALKENIADFINCAVSMFLFEEVSRRPYSRGGRNGQGGTTQTNYGKFYGQKTERLSNFQKPRANHNIEEVYYETKSDASLVLDGMLEILNSDAGQVTVADFYDLSGMSTTFTDNNFGWRELRTARIMGSPSRGYWIELPKPIALN